MTTMMQSLVMVPAPEGGYFKMMDSPCPVPGEDEVLVQVSAVALNRGELVMLERMRTGVPVIGGIEFAGTVVKSPADCQWKPGDRVVGHGRSAYAEFVCVHPSRLMHLPDALTFAEGAAVPNVFMTAHDALVTNGCMLAGESVLVNAGSSGIGTAATQIAAWLGADQIIATSRTSEKWERIKHLGATHLLATADGNIAQRVKGITKGRGVDIVIDCLGGPGLQEHLNSMALCGRLINVGRLVGPEALIDLDYLALHRLRVIGVTFRTRTEAETQACFHAFANDLFPGFESGALRPVVDSVFGFDEFGLAFERLRGGDHVGKISMTFDDTRIHP